MALYRLRGMCRLIVRSAGVRCVAVTNTYPEAELRADAELVAPGLNRLTLDALDALCAD